MAETCSKHTFEVATGVCRQCKNHYCDECLVYSFGPKKPPYCVTCALNAAGVRRAGAAPNPRLRKKGIFGKQVEVAVVPVRQKTFDEINIGLPPELMGTSTPPRRTRREASPDLVEAIANAEAALAAAPVAVEEPVAVAVAANGYGSDEREASLADWAASLGETDASDSPGRGVEAWPEEQPEIAPWPDDSDLGSDGTSF